MKLRAITSALAVCLFCSLAFADNPADARLVVADASPVIQPSSCAGHNRQHSNHKGESLSARARKENPFNNSRQAEQSNPQYPAATNN